MAHICLKTSPRSHAKNDFDTHLLTYIVTCLLLWKHEFLFPPHPFLISDSWCFHCTGVNPDAKNCTYLDVCIITRNIVFVFHFPTWNHWGMLISIINLEKDDKEDLNEEKNSHLILSFFLRKKGIFLNWIWITEWTWTNLPSFVFNKN